MSAPRTLGINGLGRIGKLTLWYHLGHDSFDRFVVNVGRPVGTSMSSIAQYVGKDSTYGPLHRYLGGHLAKPDIQVIDENTGVIRAHGKEIVFLREVRNPKDIPWRDNGVSLVVDCHGQVPRPARRGRRSQGRAPWPPGRRSEGGRTELSVQEQT